MLSLKSLPFIAAMAFCTAVASGAMIDGTVGGGEYANPPLVDTNNEVDAQGDPADFQGSGLDIDAVYAEVDATHLYLGLTVESGAFDFDGSPLSFAKMTAVYASLYADAADLAANSSLHDIAFWVYDLAGAPTVLVATVDGLPLIGYALSIGPDFEVSIPLAALPNGVGTHLKLQLDDMGAQSDDQISGQYIPEPMTVGLLAVGGLAILLRRRRRR